MFLCRVLTAGFFLLFLFAWPCFSWRGVTRETANDHVSNANGPRVQAGGFVGQLSL